jgi:tetratricopeptide (TPR) repeat protein
MPDVAGSELGSAYIWMGEAESGDGDLRAALENYTKASAALQSPAGEPVADDTRCQLTTSYIKAGDVLTKTGRWEDASASYKKALDIVTPLLSPERQDMPAMYAAADAYAGEGDVSVLRARKSSEAKDQISLFNDAGAWYEKSLSIWRNIPNQSKIGPTGFTVRSATEIARAYAQCKNNRR